MHERTRRLLCQLVFVAACALPTLGTLSMVVMRHTPWFEQWRLAKFEAELTDRFGLDFKIGTLNVLAPGVFHLEKVRLVDPETDQEVATSRVVQWIEKDGRIAIQLSQPSVHSEQLPHAWRLLHDRFLCRPELTVAPVRLAANDLTITSTTGGITLTGFDAYMRPHDYANETIAHFKIAGREMELPAAISITRDRSRTEPQTTWKLKTGGTALPCSILADYLPWLGNFGSSAEFNGLISWRLRNDGWDIDLGESEFTGIEVSRVFDRFEHKLTGTANIWFAKCRIAEGLLTSVEGSVSILNGQLGQSLLQSASSYLGVRPVAQSTRPTIPFDLLCLHFSLDDSGWQLAGGCAPRNGSPNLPPGTLAVNSDGIVAWLQTSNPIDAGAPKRMIAPGYAMPVFRGESRGGFLDMLPSANSELQALQYMSVPRTALRRHNSRN